MINTSLHIIEIGVHDSKRPSYQFHRFWKLWYYVDGILFMFWSNTNMHILRCTLSTSAQVGFAGHFIANLSLHRAYNTHICVFCTFRMSFWMAFYWSDMDSQQCIFRTCGSMFVIEVFHNDILMLALTYMIKLTYEWNVCVWYFPATHRRFRDQYGCYLNRVNAVHDPTHAGVFVSGVLSPLITFPWHCFWTQIHTDLRCWPCTSIL
jgi:hypothetical protein